MNTPTGTNPFNTLLISGKFFFIYIRKRLHHAYYLFYWRRQSRATKVFFSCLFGTLQCECHGPSTRQLPWCAIYMSHPFEWHSSVYIMFLWTDWYKFIFSFHFHFFFFVLSLFVWDILSGREVARNVTLTTKQHVYGWTGHVVCLGWMWIKWIMKNSIIISKRAVRLGVHLSAVLDDIKFGWVSWWFWRSVVVMWFFCMTFEANYNGLCPLLDADIKYALQRASNWLNCRGSHNSSFFFCLYFSYTNKVYLLVVGMATF